MQEDKSKTLTGRNVPKNAPITKASVRVSSVKMRLAVSSKPKAVHAGDVPSNTRSDGDKRWDELFANTTPEQWDKLEQMFIEDGDEDTPLDFTGR